MSVNSSRTQQCIGLGKDWEMHGSTKMAKPKKRDIINNIIIMYFLPSYVFIFLQSAPMFLKSASQSTVKTGVT